jgi:peroxin-6
VSQEDFERALSELVPSVSAAEMHHYSLVQQKFNRPPEVESVVAAVEEDGIVAPVQTKVRKDKGKGKAREAAGR